MNAKDILRKKFSDHFEKYYNVELFDKEGFTRKQCKSCGKFFWSLTDTVVCPDQPCSSYTFIGNSIGKKLDYINTWKTIKTFFQDNNHKIINRYPVVSRWRTDLYFTVASIINFQRIAGNQITFQFPSNPLLVPQVCLRFNDIQNVGISGKHLTSFCMVGQHSINDENGYWKDKCINLDFELLTNRFSIPKNEISFVEDVWLGHGAFGYSLEFFVRGLELGNAVFTSYKGNPNDYQKLSTPVIDMGAGLERFTWLTQGTPTIYDSIFEPVLKFLLKNTGITYDPKLLSKYSVLSSPFNWESNQDMSNLKSIVVEKLSITNEEFDSKIGTMQSIYSLADHVRTLIFGIADGCIPSNVGGGYNLRVLLRRALAIIKINNWNFDLFDVARIHINYLKHMYPELEEKKSEIRKILQVEETHYKNSINRVNGILNNLSNSKKELTEEQVIQFYDSDGITPEVFKQSGININISNDFYSKVTARHPKLKNNTKSLNIDLNSVDSTKLLFYSNQYEYKFKATVTKIINKNLIVLDKTDFYPRGGGQEPDTGLIGNCKVVDVIKEGSVVLHKVENCKLNEGEIVQCEINQNRRESIMKHHTSTHIINKSAKTILGSWVWQHSAFKDYDKGRIDVTHYSNLTTEELNKIELLANNIVQQNLPVLCQYMDKDKAENKYGFSIYQGGVPPDKKIRLISIGDFDIEACGGTHVNNTGEIGLIKIIKTERIQDGVIRIEFVSGNKAISYIQNNELIINKSANILESPKDKLFDNLVSMQHHFNESKRISKAIIKKYSNSIMKQTFEIANDYKKYKIYTLYDEELNYDVHINIGDLAVAKYENLIYCVLLPVKDKTQILVFCGDNLQEKGIMANNLIIPIAKYLHGSGGGTSRFAQGGGKLVEQTNLIDTKIIDLIKKFIDEKGI